MAVSQTTEHGSPGGNEEKLWSPEGVRTSARSSLCEKPWPEFSQFQGGSRLSRRKTAAPRFFRNLYKGLLANPVPVQKGGRDTRATHRENQPKSGRQTLGQSVKWDPKNSLMCGRGIPRTFCADGKACVNNSTRRVAGLVCSVRSAWCGLERWLCG